MRALFALATLVLAASMAAPQETVTGSFPPGQAYVAPEDASPVQVSRASVRTLSPRGGRASADLGVRGGSRLIVWTLPAGPSARATTALSSPSGRRLLASEAGSAEAGMRRRTAEVPEASALGRLGAAEAIEIDQTEAGVYRLDVEAAEGGAVTVVAAEPESLFTLSTSVSPLSRQPGEAIVLRAELRDGEVPVTGARVTARLAAPGRTGTSAKELFDDGRHGDGAADDGVYAVRLQPAAVPGFWTARFEASGRDERGIAYARTASGGFMNERGAARLLARSVSASVVGEGSHRRLRVEAAARVASAGTYRLDVIVAGAPSADGSRPAIAWAEAIQRLDVGLARPALEIPLGALGDGAGGPLLLDVRLLGLDPAGLAGRVAVEVLAK